MSRRLLWLSIPFRTPYVTSAATLRARDLIVLRVQERHLVAYGEAAPFESYDGISIAHIADAMRERATPGAPQIHAADEMAFLDLEGRRLGVPAVEFDEEVRSIAVHRTLAGATPEEVADAAAAGAADGFDCFKLKVGLADDEARVAAVRDAVGPDARLRLDANGAWSAKQAVERIRRVAGYDIEFVEQPCRTLAELAAVRAAVDVRIAADESVQSADDVSDAARAEACDVVAIKLAPMGGITAARNAIEAARAAGLDAYVSSTVDGPWGIAAGLQLAAAERIDTHCGLATLGLFDAALADVLPAPRGGRIEVPAGPGLGVEVPEDAIAEVLVSEL